MNNEITNQDEIIDKGVIEGLDTSLNVHVEEILPQTEVLDILPSTELEEPSK